MWCGGKSNKSKWQARRGAINTHYSCYFQMETLKPQMFLFLIMWLTKKLCLFIITLYFAEHFRISISLQKWFMYCSLSEKPFHGKLQWSRESLDAVSVWKCLNQVKVICSAVSWKLERINLTGHVLDEGRGYIRQGFIQQMASFTDRWWCDTYCLLLPNNEIHLKKVYKACIKSNVWIRRLKQGFC